MRKFYASSTILFSVFYFRLHPETKFILLPGVRIGGEPEECRKISSKRLPENKKMYKKIYWDYRGETINQEGREHSREGVSTWNLTSEFFSLPTLHSLRAARNSETGTKEDNDADDDGRNFSSLYKKKEREISGSGLFGAWKVSRTATRSPGNKYKLRDYRSSRASFFGRAASHRAFPSELSVFIQTRRTSIAHSFRSLLRRLSWLAWFNEAQREYVIFFIYVAI